MDTQTQIFYLHNILLGLARAIEDIEIVDGDEYFQYQQEECVKLQKQYDTQ